MESITNAASSVVNTASNLIYGQPGKENETGGKEPVSGEQGKGTPSEPFDQGNKATSSNTSYSQGDFTKSDNAGASGQEWKPTSLDEVKPEGAPGAGPPAPENVTPATGDTSASTSNKAEESTSKTTDSNPEPKKDSEAKDASESDAPKRPMSTHSAGGDVDKILESEPKKEHTVDDSEASDPHSKMTGVTHRQTDASQHGESENTKNLAEEKTKDSSASRGSGDASEGGEEKSKMSTKDKLKQKLHIGHKDK